jgi:hypothetical protein
LPAVDRLLINDAWCHVLLLGRRGSLSEFHDALLVNFGQVPLFFYLTHIALIHLSAVLIAFIRFGHAERLYQGPGIFWSEPLPGRPENYGLSLAWVGLLWLLLVAILYSACLAYGRYKRSHDQIWLRYL